MQHSGSMQCWGCSAKINIMGQELHLIRCGTCFHLRYRWTGKEEGPSAFPTLYPTYAVLNKMLWFLDRN